MVNLITNNVNTGRAVSVQNVQHKPEKTEQQVATKLGVPNDLFEKSDINKNVIPASLVAIGGILMFLGLKHPSEKSIYKKYVARNIMKMDLLSQKYISQIRLIINDKMLGVEKFIDDFKASHFLDVNAHVPAIKNQDNYRHVLDSQDFAFDSIYSYRAKQHHMGASDMGLFITKMDDALRQSASEIAGPQNATTLAIQDIVSVPLAKNSKNVAIVDYAEDQLITMRNILVSQLESSKNTFFNTSRNAYSDKMAKAIINSREQITTAKENVLYATFDKLRELLKLSSDFQPNFKIVPSDENFKALSPEEMLPNPNAMPKNINRLFKNNLFYKIVMEKDLSKLSPDDLKSIFFSLSDEHSLKDLGYLIDRLRLHKVVDEATYAKPQKQFDVVIAKLEFLSHKLNGVGKRRLYSSLNRDFHNMNLQQRHAALYWVFDDARRMGYSGIEAMDKDLMQKYPVYKGLSFRAYMDIFKENPDLYFM